MRRFVVGDIHGNYKGLLEALKGASFVPDKDLLISLGDIVDGHSESYQVVDYLSKLPNCIAIQGNHDLWFKQFFNKFENNGKAMGLWVNQGGRATLQSYGYSLFNLNPGSSTGSYLAVGGDIPKSHKEYLNKQVPYYLSEDGLLFIHAGLEEGPLATQNESALCWDREMWQYCKEYASRDLDFLRAYFNFDPEIKRIFIGHSAVRNIEFLPEISCGVTNIDTGGGFYGKVTVYNIDTNEYYQSKEGRELYPDFQGR